MGRIGLIADTHVPEAGDLPPAACSALAGCDQILHCGDLHTIDVVDRLEQIAPVLVSRGNGDTREPRGTRPGVEDDPRVRDSFVVDVGAFRIGLVHDLDHLHGRSHDQVAAKLAERFGGCVDIAVYGHNHVPSVWGLDDGTALVNPGSATMPYGYLGLDGTIGMIDVFERRFEVTIFDLASGRTQLHLDGPTPRAFVTGPRPEGGR